jgi:hypothetical protein
VRKLSRSRLDTPARHQTAAELARAAAAYFDAYFDARREGHEVALAFAGLFGAADFFVADLLAAGLSDFLLVMGFFSGMANR